MTSFKQIEVKYKLANKRLDFGETEWNLSIILKERYDNGECRIEVSRSSLGLSVLRYDRLVLALQELGIRCGVYRELYTDRSPMQLYGDSLPDLKIYIVS